MTSSKFATEGTHTSSTDIPPLERPVPAVNGTMDEDDDDNGFQTVVSKRTARLQQQQIRYNNRSNNRGYGNYGGHHGYGNSNGHRSNHYHRQYGPPHSHSSGTSNSSASSIPDELPIKDLSHDQHQTTTNRQTTSDSPLPPIPAPSRPQLNLPPPASPPVIAWARIAAGDIKPPKPEVPQSPGNTITCHSPVNNSNSSFDVKPIAISLVASACDGRVPTTDDRAALLKTPPLKKTNTHCVPPLPTSSTSSIDELDHVQSASASSSTQQSQELRPQTQMIVPPPPPSVWVRRAAAAAALANGSNKIELAQTPSPNSASAVVAGTSKPKLQSTTRDWPSLNETSRVQTIRTSEDKEALAVTQSQKHPHNGSSRSESSTDSGNEEIIRITGAPELSDEKWPLPVVGNSTKKPNGQIQTETTHTKDTKQGQSRHSSGDAMSSSGCDQGGTGDPDGNDANENKKKKKNKKSTKPKWLPFALDTEPQRPTKKPTKKRFERPLQQRNGDANAGAVASGGVDGASSEAATPTESTRSKGSSGGGGSGPGRGGRNGHKGKRNQGYYRFYKEPADPSQITTDGNGENFADYSGDFANVNSMYTMTELYIPYTTYASSTYSPPPEAQSYAFTQIPIDEATVAQLIQRQIEYYFSEENLEKDFYLRRRMDSDGYIPIALIATFFRIQYLTQDYGVLLNAIKTSELIEIKEDDENNAYARPILSPTKWPIVDPVIPITVMSTTTTKSSSSPPSATAAKSFFTTIVTPTNSTDETTGNDH